MKYTDQSTFSINAAGPVEDLTQVADGRPGQRVKGTSSGSEYHIVASKPGVAMAMRWKGGALSVRVAGPQLASAAERLKATGLFVDHGTYWSAHLNQQATVGGIGAEVSAQMLYASLIAAGAADWEYAAPFAWTAWTTPGKVN